MNNIGELWMRGAEPGIRELRLFCSDRMRSNYDSIGKCSRTDCLHCAGLGWENDRYDAIILVLSQPGVSICFQHILDRLSWRMTQPICSNP